jgi:MFS transporter, ACS family, glucarate transporter
MNMGSNLGGLISPALTPVLAASIGWESALLVSAAFAIVAAALWLWIPAPFDKLPG